MFAVQWAKIYQNVAFDKISGSLYVKNLSLDDDLFDAAVFVLEYIKFAPIAEESWGLMYSTENPLAVVFGNL